MLIIRVAVFTEDGEVLAVQDVRDVPEDLMIAVDPDSRQDSLLERVAAAATNAYIEAVRK